MKEEKKSSSWRGALYVLGSLYILVGALFATYSLIMNRYECVQAGGFSGFFWCPESVHETFIMHGIYIVAWPFYI